VERIPNRRWPTDARGESGGEPGIRGRALGRRPCRVAFPAASAVSAQRDAENRKTVEAGPRIELGYEDLQSMIRKFYACLDLVSLLRFNQLAGCRHPG
jgi:hypothetical protein